MRRIVAVVNLMLERTNHQPLDKIKIPQFHMRMTQIGTPKQKQHRKYIQLGIHRLVDDSLVKIIAHAHQYRRNHEIRQVIQN